MKLALRISLTGTARAAIGALLSLGIGAAQGAGWLTFPVDDSMSQASAAQFRWRERLPTRDGSNVLDASAAVRIVLNVSPWMGKTARIYMVMPTLPQSMLTIQWTTTGILLPGQLAGGQRQLVFQGVIAGARIEDTMHVTATTDARDAATPPRVNFTFEIEVPS